VGFCAGKSLGGSARLRGRGLVGRSGWNSSIGSRTGRTSTDPAQAASVMTAARDSSDAQAMEQAFTEEKTGT